MKTLPAQYAGDETENQARATYLYIFDHGGTLYHVTNFDQPITVTGLPAALGGTGDVTFLSGSCMHTELEQSDENSEPTTTVSVAINHGPEYAELQSAFLTASGKTVLVTIARANGSSLPGPITWDVNTYVEFAGTGVAVQFQDYQVNIALESIGADSGGEIPRFRYQRTCQVPLYGPLCGLDKTALAYKMTTTVAAVNRPARTVDIADILFGDGGPPITAPMLEGGFLSFGTPEVLVTISHVEILPAAAGTRQFLCWWPRGIVATSAIFVYRGCDRTPAMCAALGNLANFRGTPYVPNVNPVIHGIRT